MKREQSSGGMACAKTVSLDQQFSTSVYIGISSRAFKSHRCLGSILSILDGIGLGCGLGIRAFRSQDENYYPSRPPTLQGVNFLIIYV